MGARGAIVMSFFGAVFAAMTLNFQFHWKGLSLGWPFAGFAVILVLAVVVLRQPGIGVEVSKRTERAILWSSAGEGIGILIAVNVVNNLHHAEWLLPSIALVVGLHFFPIAYAARFWPLYVLGGALLLGAALGFVLEPPRGGAVAGFAAAGILWVYSLLVILRDLRVKRRLTAQS